MTAALLSTLEELAGRDGPVYRCATVESEAIVSLDGRHALLLL
jgi:hypothetical protein